MNFIFLSTTSKHKKDYLKLPDKYIINHYHSNFLVSDINVLNQIIKDYNKENTVFVLDAEKKQHISLYDEAFLDNKIDYKPNDLTMEAADLTVLNYFNSNLSNKTVGIIGTGNIAFKLALRLSERNVKVHIFGRNTHKVSVCVEALKQVTFDNELIHYGNSNSNLNCIVSFLSAEEVVTHEYNKLLEKNSLCLDGGIGNFSKEFISSALESGHDVRRLDVRQSQEILEGYIKSRLGSQFSKIIGRGLINNYHVVAGGIIGAHGQVIVDKIVEPTKVIGIADGIGGVKNESDLNAEERNKIKEVQKAIKQNI